MHYSFRNTICGLAVLVAAGFLAEVANAQIVSLMEEETISLPADDEFSVSEDINNLNNNISASGLISPQQPSSVSSDLIPMEGSSGMTTNFDEEDDFADINMSIESPASSAAQLVPAQKVAQPTAEKNLLGAPTQGFDQRIAPAVNNELFSKMSSLEKEATLLSLELKKERIANEVAAVKAQRQKAELEEQARLEEEEKKKIEWENEQERLLIAEQTKLKEAAAALEQLRQEKIVKAYKATMLEVTQKWIKNNAEIYAKMAQKENEIKTLIDDSKTKMATLQQKADDLKGKAEVAKINHDKTVANLESQISTLKLRLEKEIESNKKKLAAATTSSNKKNPFAMMVGADGTIQKPKLSQEYAIMEVIGQGEELAAKLINIDGDVFMVKQGTTLKNGFTVEEVAQTYISAVKDNERDFLYFAAGGILDREPPTSQINLKSTAPADSAQPVIPVSSKNSTQGIPSLGTGMFIK